MNKADLDKAIAAARTERNKPTEKHVITKPDGTVITTTINYRNQTMTTKTVTPIKRKKK